MVDDRSWSNVAEEFRGPRRRQLGGGTAGTQITKQAVEPVDRPAALPGELVTSVGEEPKHGAVVLGTDSVEVGLALGHPGDAGSVDAIGLAPLAGSEEACSRHPRESIIDDR